MKKVENKSNKIVIAVGIVFLVFGSIAYLIPRLISAREFSRVFSGSTKVIQDNEQQEVFEKENRTDFDEVNNFILSVKDSKHVMQQVNEHGLCNFSIKKENGKIVDLSNFPTENKEKMLKALNRIAAKFKQDFSYIQIEGNFINYGGIGPTMYKYSINGDAPTFFFEEDDGMSFDAYKLSEHWYYLEANVH